MHFLLLSLCMYVSCRLNTGSFLNLYHRHTLSCIQCHNNSQLQLRKQNHVIFSHPDALCIIIRITGNVYYYAITNQSVVQLQSCWESPTKCVCIEPHAWNFKGYIQFGAKSPIEDRIPKAQRGLNKLRVPIKHRDHNTFNLSCSYLIGAGSISGQDILQLNFNTGNLLADLVYGCFCIWML